MGKQGALPGTGAGLHMGREEFRQWAMEKGIRAERVAGEVVLMAPERVRHNRVKLNVVLALKEAIQAAGRPCEAFTDGLTIEVGEDTDYEPDAVVSCGDRLDEEAIAVPDPVIIVEVESPSTWSVDAGGKLADYFRVTSVRHYLIVRTRQRQVIHHCRDGERIETRIVNGGTLELDPPGIAVAIERFYSG
jgi:Uma2 family endonuclease